MMNDILYRGLILREFQLKEKTIVYTGPFTRLSQCLTATFTEWGANIALITKDHHNAQRFTDNINEAREANPRYGRAIAILASTENTDSIKEALGTVAEHFGSIDIIIDAHLTEGELLKQAGSAKGVTEKLLKELTCWTQNWVEFGLPYLTGRKKGRMIFLHYETPPLNKADKLQQTTVLESLRRLIDSFNSEINNHKVTLNSLSLGLTEDYLLHRFPEEESIKSAFDEIKKVHPEILLMDSTDVAHVIGFLSSALSTGINGQSIKVNYGFQPER
jgi:3-oxoacyl-[acyl-carrier protein] reductase